MGTHTRTMGRRKIDIAYLTDDRVRKVTFCKRKGGLFKNADDLSKLCGVEVAVVIVGDKKTCEYASTDMNRILDRYKEMQAGGAVDDMSETSRLWERLETQRREPEAITRELAAEKRQVEELRANQAMHPAAVQIAADTHESLMPIASLMQPSVLHKPVVAPAPAMLPRPTGSDVTTGPQLVTTPAVIVSAPTMSAMKHGRCTSNVDELSDDTAEVEDSVSDGTCVDEPSAKRVCLEKPVESFSGAAIQAPLVAATAVQVPTLQ